MITAEPETIVQCCRCNNQHKFDDRIQKPVRGSLMRKYVCPHCKSESYVIPVVLTDQEKSILMHMLGIRNVRRLPQRFLRNSFFAEEGHPDLPTLQSLIEKKIVDCGFANPKIFGENTKCYWVTEVGTYKIRKEKILR